MAIFGRYRQGVGSADFYHIRNVPTFFWKENA